MKRHPHIAHLISNSTERDDNGDLIGESEKIQLEGRFQVASGSGKEVDYDAKFFTPKMDVDSFDLDEATLEYEGKQFKIVKHFNYQMYSVLWLI